MLHFESKSNIVDKSKLQKRYNFARGIDWKMMCFLTTGYEHLKYKRQNIKIYK